MESAVTEGPEKTRARAVRPAAAAAGSDESPARDGDPRDLTRSFGVEPDSRDPATERYDALDPETLRDRYVIGPVIGRGATGIVRHGQDRLLGRDVAIKSLYPHLVADDAVRTRFLREAQLAARLQHPHAVVIHDVDDGPEPFIVMEYLSGGTLAERIRDAPLSPSAVSELGHQILAALAAAHRSGIVHRDIKPANIMFAGDGVAKLVDFGIATSADQTNHTATGIVLGTMSYLAPERLCGKRADEATDIYSVGVVLYEAITGAPPFQSDSPASMVRAITSAEDAPDITRSCPDVDPALAATIARALHQDPAHRFASATDMAAALPVCDTPSRVASASTASMASPASMASSAPPASRAPDRARVVPRWIVAAIIVAILAIGLVRATRGGGAPDEPRTQVDVTVDTDPALDQAIDDLEAAVRGS